jgi:ubiquinone/menaquinone biosynthesis C-methylase UbiE
MSPDRSVSIFDDRAESYDSGRLARWHTRIVTRAADVATTASPVPLRLLDIGCGTGRMLVEFTLRLPTAMELVGVDASLPMVRRATQRLEGRAQVIQARAEQLPLPDAHFDLVVSTMSLDHWSDPGQGLREAARVLSASGVFVLADLCGWWLPSRGHPRHRRALLRVAQGAGFELDRRQTIYRVAGLPLVQVFVLRK